MQLCELVLQLSLLVPSIIQLVIETLFSELCFSQLLLSLLEFT